MSKVFFLKDANKGDQLFDAADLGKIITQNDLVAVKVHFGEMGNTAYVKPERIKPVIDKIKSRGGNPFLTDANTIYKGSRSNAVFHLETAQKHGFTSLNIPMIIADGLHGHSYTKVEVNLKHFKEVFIASAVIEADTLVVLSHFKGHEVAGFGGAIKNVGMGLGSRAGKQQMHADIRPVVNKNNCTGCGNCILHCPVSAIIMTSDNKAEIDQKKCIGCAECIASCKFGGLSISWQGDATSLQEKMVEYMAGVLKNKKDKVAYINYLIDISPNCDCYDHNDPPIVPDIGILASFDPVALDQASLDLVGEEKLRKIWPEIDPTIQLKYAEEIGLGSRKYELVKI